MKKIVFNKVNMPMIVFVLIIVLACGIALSFYAMNESKIAIIEEHDKHIIDHASTIDHNITLFTERCFLELEDIVVDVDINNAIKTFLNNGDDTELINRLQKDSFLKTDFVHEFLITDFNSFYISNLGSNEIFTLLSYDIESKICILRNKETEEAYLAYFIYDKDSDIYYCELLNIPAFFGKMVISSIYKDYWIVLYNSATGLVMHNDYDTPSFYLTNIEDIKNRNDGLTILQKSDELGENLTEDYIYKGDDRTIRSRTCTLSKNNSENGYFSIGVSVYEDTIMKPTKIRYIHTMLASFLIAISGCILIAILFNSKKSNIDQQSKLQILEKENEIANELLTKQDELSHHQKLETMGILTSGIAHEFNNLLAPIMGNSMLIIEEYKENDSAFEKAVDIYNASEKAKKLIQKISKLSRKEVASQMKLLSVNELIDSVMSVCNPSIPKDIQVLIEKESNSYILGEETELIHMLLNLIINANQAMEDGGGVIIIHTFDKDDKVYITISDTGTGIPDDVIDHIFDPFYTTKAPGKGTGLGLSLALQTMTNHKAKISASNLKEKGACFTLEFTSVNVE